MRFLVFGTGLAMAAALAVSPALANPIDGTYTAATFPGNDDNSTGPLNLGFNFDFFGTTYSQLWLNNNGNVTFAGPQNTYSPFGLSGPLGNPIIAPFFGDVDTRSATSGVVTYQAKASGIDGDPTFGVEWPHVNYYNDTTGSKQNTFELLIVDRDDIGAGDADVYFNYGSIQWETGNASGGSNGLGGDCAVAGYSNGSGDAGTNYQIPGSGVCGSLINGGPDQLMTATNDGVAGQFLFTVRNGVITPVTPSDVPEPASLVLLGSALAGLGLIRRRRA